jgi:hypothetical protein
MHGLSNLAFKCQGYGVLPRKDFIARMDSYFIKAVLIVYALDGKFLFTLFIVLNDSGSSDL